MQEKRVISLLEAGRLLGICRNSAYKYAATGQLPTIRLGRKLLVPLAEFEKILAVSSVSAQGLSK